MAATKASEKFFRQARFFKINNDRQWSQASRLGASLWKKAVYLKRIYKHLYKRPFILLNFLNNLKYLFTTKTYKEGSYNGGLAFVLYMSIFLLLKKRLKIFFLNKELIRVYCVDFQFKFKFLTFSKKKESFEFLF